MMIRNGFAGTLILFVLGGVTASAAGDFPHGDPRCAQVTAGKPIVFHGRRLVETPDITTPELRRANSLLSHRCRDETEELLGAYIDTHPADFQGAFIEARLVWTGASDYEAEKIIETTLREHPDFTSMQVLRASMLIEQQHWEEAATLLNSLLLHSPTDLWVYLDGLQLEARRSPSQALRATLLEINKDPRFPPSAREMASKVGRQLPNISRDQFEAFYWADLDYESATPMACKIHTLALLLSEDGGRFAQVRSLLESPKAQSDDCPNLESNRMLLAQAYLMEAARINAVPTAANSALVDKAHDVMGDDWPDLARYVTGRPQYTTLQPFIAERMHPDTADQYGRTQICNAVTVSDVAAVQALLNSGADPNGKCTEYSLIGYIVMNGRASHIEEHQQILKLLRGAGGQVTPQHIESCRNPDNGPFCAQYYLSLLAP